jgi:hypothetical protein
MRCAGWLELVEVPEQAASGPDADSIFRFDPEGFQGAHAEAVDELVAAKVGIEFPTFPLGNHGSLFTRRALQRVHEV